MAPQEWELEEGKPCSGERMLLMYDRWRKLCESWGECAEASLDGLASGVPLT